MSRNPTSSAAFQKFKALSANDGFVRIVLKKSPFGRVQDADSIGFAFPSSRQSRLWHQLGEFPKVLGGCCELKLFICAFGSS